VSENIVRQYFNAGKEAYLERADRDIEKNRKADFKITYTDKFGKVIPNLEIRAKHKTHDFDFGCNTFMLEQYDEEAKNRKYEENWIKLFNTGVVPLYWEGTEPEQGKLRYDKSTKNDVYRRPPADMVCDFLEKNGKRLKGHPLFWHEFIPSWLPNDFEELKPLAEKRFKEISERYSNRIDDFDCVNEPTRIWGVDVESKNKNWPHLVPPDDYCEFFFELGKKYFPENNLILNETVGASFLEFHGSFSAFYLNIKDLLSKGKKIDKIGLQCHLGEVGFQNVYDASRLYQIFDTYSNFGLPLVLSEISIPSTFAGESDFELQKDCADMLYKVCFSHPMLSGIFWWNMTDDGVFCTKHRFAEGENLPSQGLIDFNYNKKPAYEILDELINRQWKTNICEKTDADGKIFFRGFTGKYEIVANGKTVSVDLTKEKANITIQL